MTVNFSERRTKQDKTERNTRYTRPRGDGSSQDPRGYSFTVERYTTSQIQTNSSTRQQPDPQRSKKA